MIRPATDSKNCAATTRCKCQANIQRRYILAAMSFFGLFHMANLRVNLSCAIVAMTTNHSSLIDDAILTPVSTFTTKSSLIIISYLFFRIFPNFSII